MSVGSKILSNSALVIFLVSGHTQLACAQLSEDTFGRSCGLEDTEACFVSLIDLIVHPLVYDGKQVTLLAAVVAYEDSPKGSAFLTTELARLGDSSNAVALRLLGKNCEIDNHLVVVRGKFQSPDEGDSYRGTVTEAVLLEPISSTSICD